VKTLIRVATGVPTATERRDLPARHTRRGPANRSSARSSTGICCAADLPAAILSLHVNPAVRWVTYARRDWTDYLAIRAAEQKTSHAQ
jgi:hypothetical protein